MQAKKHWHRANFSMKMFCVFSREENFQYYCPGKNCGETRRNNDNPRHSSRMKLQHETIPFVHSETSEAMRFFPTCQDWLTSESWVGENVLAQTNCMIDSHLFVGQNRAGHELSPTYWNLKVCNYHQLTSLGSHEKMTTDEGTITIGENEKHLPRAS